MLIMPWLRRLFRFRLVALALLTLMLTLGLAVSPPGNVQAQSELPPLMSLLPDRWEFVPPSTPNQDTFIPINREPGGSRCGELCISGNDKLIALVPVSGRGTTIAEYPTFFWSMPKTSAETVEFVLRDDKNRIIYAVQYALGKEALTKETLNKDVVTSHSGIMSLTLPTSANLSPLEIGQSYYWELALICDHIDRSADLVIGGEIQRVEPSSTLVNRLVQATPEERIALYAQERLWYETLGTLIELRRDRPDDKTLANAWNKLLKSVELGEGTDTFGLSQTKC